MRSNIKNIALKLCDVDIYFCSEKDSHHHHNDVFQKNSSKNEQHKKYINTAKQSKMFKTLKLKPIEEYVASLTNQF